MDLDTAYQTASTLSTPCIDLCLAAVYNGSVENLRYTIILREEPEGGFTVSVPALPGCITYGKSLAEAKKMVQDAIRGYIISLKKHGEPIPSDSTSFIASIELKEHSRKRSPAYA